MLISIGGYILFITFNIRVGKNKIIKIMANSYREAGYC